MVKSTNAGTDKDGPVVGVTGDVDVVADVDGAVSNVDVDGAVSTVDVDVDDAASTVDVGVDEMELLMWMKR